MDDQKIALGLKFWELLPRPCHINEIFYRLQALGSSWHTLCFSPSGHDEGVAEGLEMWDD